MFFIPIHSGISAIQFFPIYWVFSSRVGIISCRTFQELLAYHSCWILDFFLLEFSDLWFDFFNPHFTFYHLLLRSSLVFSVFPDLTIIFASLLISRYSGAFYFLWTIDSLFSSICCVSCLSLPVLPASFLANSNAVVGFCSFHFKFTFHDLLVFFFGDLMIEDSKLHFTCKLLKKNVGTQFIKHRRFDWLFLLPLEILNVWELKDTKNEKSNVQVAHKMPYQSRPRCIYSNETIPRIHIFKMKGIIISPCRVLIVK